MEDSVYRCGSLVSQGRSDKILILGPHDHYFHYYIYYQRDETKKWWMWTFIGRFGSVLNWTILFWEFWGTPFWQSVSHPYSSFWLQVEDITTIEDGTNIH